MSLNRRPGAKPGNTNALKHGFYSRHLKKQDLNGVDSTTTQSLAEEIALIRVFTRRLIESSSPNADIYELAGVLRAICLASATITRVIKAHTFLVNDPSSFYREIDQAIRDVRLELGIDDASAILGDPLEPSDP